MCLYCLYIVSIYCPRCLGGGRDYSGVGQSEQTDTKDGFEELCPVCGDKETPTQPKI